MSRTVPTGLIVRDELFERSSIVLEGVGLEVRLEVRLEIIWFEQG